MTFRVKIISPIRIDQADLERRQVRYGTTASPGTQITVCNLPEGPTTLDTVADIVACEYQVFQVGATTRENECDAILIDCVFDPAVDAIQKHTGIPTFGPMRTTLSLVHLVAQNFAIIARITDPSSKPLKVSQMAGEIIQCVLLSVILVFVLFILSVPAICLVSSLALFLPALGSLPLLVLSLILVWALLPIVFSPHGIFANRFKAGASIANSFRLVRSSMNGTGMLFIVLILLGYGLDTLWSTPAPDSWMLLVGIVGHGFISSGLIAASFAFYNKGMVWLQAVVREINAGKPKIIS